MMGKYTLTAPYRISDRMVKEYGLEKFVREGA